MVACQVFRDGAEESGVAADNGLALGEGAFLEQCSACQRQPYGAGDRLRGPTGSGEGPGEGQVQAGEPVRSTSVTENLSGPVRRR